MTLSEMADRIHTNAKNKGFWDEPKSCNDFLAWVTSEIGEAYNEYRKNKLDIRLEEEGKPEGFGIELADVIILVLDYCKGHNIPIQQLVELKMAYNETRPKKHGRK